MSILVREADKKEEGEGELRDGISDTVIYAIQKPEDSSEEGSDEKAS